MTSIFLLKTLHYTCFGLLLYSSGMKNKLLMPISIDMAALQRVRRFDKLSAAAAGVILLTGLVTVFGLAKPSTYYLSHPFFVLKVSIFVVASGLIVLTKIAFRKALQVGVEDKATGAWIVPPSVRLMLRIDFFGLLLMAAIGFCLARGYV